MWARAPWNPGRVLFSPDGAHRPCVLVCVSRGRVCSSPEQGSAPAHPPCQAPRLCCLAAQPQHASARLRGGCGAASRRLCSRRVWRRLCTTAGLGDGHAVLNLVALPDAVVFFLSLHFALGPPPGGQRASPLTRFDEALEVQSRGICIKHRKACPCTKHSFRGT